MKRNLLPAFFLITTSLFLIGCQDLTGNNNKPSVDIPEEEPDNFEEQIALMQGQYYDNSRFNSLEEAKEYGDSGYPFIKNNIITHFLGDETHELSNLWRSWDNLEEEYKTILKGKKKNTIFCYNDQYHYYLYTFELKGNKLEVYFYNKGLVQNDKYKNVTPRYYLKVSNNNSGSETVTLEGQYKITQANNSTISFNNGHWTYNYSGQTKSGTYSQSGNEITISFTQNGINIEAVFTVTKNNDTIILKGKSGDTVAIISNAFMINDYNVLSSEEFTLTVN